MADPSPVGDAISPQLIARIVELIPVGVLAKDPRRELRYVLWNEAMAGMTGRPAAEVLGRTDHDLYPAEVAHSHVEADREVLSTGRLVRRQGHVSRHTIPGHQIDVTKLPLRDEQGAIALVLTIIEDVTEQRRLERQVLQAQKMEAVSRLAGGIAHDFNNLLQVMMGYGELLRGELPPGKAQVDMDRVLKAGRQAVGLVSQMLTFSRPDFVRTETVDLEELIDGQLDVIDRVLGDDVKLVWDPAGDLPQALADPDQLRQILLDLCVNARDAMPGGGTLTIATAHEELDEAWCLRNPELTPGHYVSLIVKDTGMGIPPELQTTIFEPFFTTKNVEGAGGLGLSAVYAAVRAHGGAIAVSSRPGEGATFRLRLPSTDAPARKKTVAPVAMTAGTVEPGQPVSGPSPAEQTRAAARAHRDLGQGRLVLLAEDQDDVRELTASILERAGFRVLRARDGVEGVEMFQTSSRPVDLLVLDVIMPRLNGRDAYRAMIEGREPVPVIFCSGYDDAILTRDFLLDTPGELLQKPYRAGDLLEHAARALGRRARSDEA